MIKKLGALVILATVTMLSPAFADGVRSTNCLVIRGMISCVTAWRHLASPTTPTEQEIAEARERERRWVARCRPVIKQDSLGVGRYLYAAPGCEYGRLD